MRSSAFSKQNSLAVKGVAILMMLWHHCFLPGRFEDYNIAFSPLSQSQAVNIALFFKICVSLFAFISGYGLSLSWQAGKQEGKRVSGWLWEKLVRTYSSYWFVVVLSWIVCSILDNRPYAAYGFADSKYAAVWKMCIDFLGLSNFFGTGTLMGTWWYMSAAVIFVVLLPVLDKSMEMFGSFCTMCLVFILPRMCGGCPGNDFLSFLPALCFGMIFAKKNLFAKWRSVFGGGSNGRVKRTLRFVLLSMTLLLTYKLYYHLPDNTWWDVNWGIFPVIVILFVYDVLIPIKPVNAVLVFLGKHATNIWLVHTFIRAFYCQDFIYGQGHFLAVIGMLLLTSLIVSLIIEFLKKITRYADWIQKLSDIYTKSSTLST